MRVRINVLHCSAKDDREWARWLCRELARFRLPPDYRHFRLSPRSVLVPDSGDDGPDWAPDDRFVVVASPKAAASETFNSILRKIQREHSRDTIGVWLGRGDPQSSFPSTLLKGGEPVAANPKARKGESPRWRKRLELLRLVAMLLGCELEDLRQRDRKRQRKRMQIALSIASASAVLAVALALNVCSSRNKAITDRDDAGAYLERALRYRDRAMDAVAFVAEAKTGAWRTGSSSDLWPHMLLVQTLDILDPGASGRSRTDHPGEEPGESERSDEILSFHLRTMRRLGDSHASAESVTEARTAYKKVLNRFQSLDSDRRVRYPLVREAIICHSRLADLILGNAPAARGVPATPDPAMSETSRFGPEGVWRLGTFRSVSDEVPMWWIVHDRVDLAAAHAHLVDALELCRSARGAADARTCPEPRAGIEPAGA